MEVQGFPPTIVRIQPDMAVLRFACITCMLSTSRILCCFSSSFWLFCCGGGRGWGWGWGVLVFVVVFFFVCGFFFFFAVYFCLVCLFSVVC